MLLVDCMRHVVALNCSLMDIQNTYNRYIYENCTVQLASVGLAQACPNKYHANKYYVNMKLPEQISTISIINSMVSSAIWI